MSKTKKREKSLLNKFKNYSDAEFLALLKVSIYQYEVLFKSEQKAKEILAKYGVATLINLNADKKERLERLIEVAKLRNLSIPESWFQVEITPHDIKARIEQFKWEEVNWIEKHNYLFDLNICPELKVPKSEHESSDEVIKKICSLFDRIIAENILETNLEQNYATNDTNLNLVLTK